MSLRQSSEDENLAPASAHALSLLTARRPSFACTSGSLPSFCLPDNVHNTRAENNLNVDPLIFQGERSVGRPDFSRGLRIKMQGWVGEGVGKMSISPSGRDIVLANRSGLYVIDLEVPLEIPRFLPQGGTWDVADVQWNPHPSRANYVVSTSSEKLIIWNLDRPDRSAIQFILSRHYRSITDLNWHNHNPDLVASTGIDSWIWMWDLRAGTRPVTGLCAFNSGATQVKWNRHDENILASSHGNTLLIWDQRKGAVPLTTIKAHTARIYGIDWSRRDANEIVTCSLDQSIKFWNISPSDIGAGDAIPRPPIDAPTHAPRKQINTTYPVWRARHVPFGDGVLSLPQRGVKPPELFYQDSQIPIDVMTNNGIGESQMDIVKEYVWRSKGGSDIEFDDREFQLVTWSEDRTLKAWPIDSGTLERVGVKHGHRIEDVSHRSTTKYETYREPPTTSRITEHIVSMPVGGRGIFAGLRSSPTSGSKQGNFPDLFAISKLSKETNTGTGTLHRGGTMTKGAEKRKRSGMHALAWMPGVTVGEKRDGSAPDSLASSRLSLDHANSELRAREGGFGSPQTNSSIASETFESDATPSWADELVFVVNGLSLSKMAKISLEKMELKKRTCTLGLQGPWGESSSVFIRVTFTFPRNYPRSLASESLPHIDLEKNHLIPVKNRTFLLRELRELRKKPPCLEPCLRFLLGLKGVHGRSIDTDSGSSSEEEAIGDDTRPNRDTSVTMRGQTGVAEPRTSQGVFGPNGELICFSHMPLRMMRTMGRSLSLSPSTTSSAPQNSTGNNQSSGVLFDALRRLTAVAHDRQSTPPGTTSADEELLRTLESLAQPKRPITETPQSSDVLDSAFFLRHTWKSIVTVRDVSDLVGLDRTVAKEYAVSGTDAGSFCQYNARVAHAHGRYDHERVFKTLYALIRDTSRPLKISAQEMSTTLQWHRNHISHNVILSFFEESSQKKDILMLAMISVALFLSEKTAKIMRERAVPQAILETTPSIRSDYFSLPRPHQNRTRTLSNASSFSQRSPQSPTTPGAATSLSSSASSRGSWSSILNASASGVRFLMSGSEGTATPRAQNSPIERSRTLPISDLPLRVEGFSAGPRTPEGPERIQSPQPNDTRRHVGTTQSWSEPISAPSLTPSRITVSFASAGNFEGHEYVNPRSRPPRKHVVVGIRADLSDSNDYMTKRKSTDGLCTTLVQHIIAYSEVLFRWGLLHKRAELLNCLSKEDARAIMTDATNNHELATANICLSCRTANNGNRVQCPSCTQRLHSPPCTICRVPANGLAHVCLVCCHVTHSRCWHARERRLCPAGCGCDCTLPDKTFSSAGTQPSIGVAENG